MAKKIKRKNTIATFRAEKGLYLEDLAKNLQVDEDLLKNIEQSDAENIEVQNKIIEFYELPTNYFDFNTNTIEKITVDKPFAFFWKESFIWMLLVTLIQFVFGLPNLVLAPLNIEGVATIMSGLQDIASSILTIFFATKLSARIMQRSTYGEEVKKYNYIIYYVSSAAVCWVNRIGNLGLTYALSTGNSTNEFGVFLIQSGIAYILWIILIVLQTIVMAKMLEALVMENRAKADRNIMILSLIAIISTAVYFGIGALGTEHLGLLISVLLIKMAIIILITFGVNFGWKKNEKFWLKTLPIILIIGYSIFAFVFNVASFFVNI